MVHVFNRQHAFSIGGALSLFIFTSLVSNAVAAAARRRTTENETYFENAVALNPVGGSGSDLRPINVITLEKEPLVSGSRVEPMGDEVRESPFLGYTKKGMSLVQPHSPFMYVLFGFWLDEVTEIAFTVSNCSFPDYSIFQKDFVLQTDKRIIVHTMFEEHHLPLRLCLKQKVRDTTEEAVFEEIMEPRTMISTEYPQRTYYFNFYLQICIISCFLVLSGLFSGLNLGLMALTPQELMLIEKSGSDTERRYAETILPVRKKGNLLLCSLLIGNVCVNSAISILFDDLTSGYVALIVSSAGIVIFGEIFPQSVCVKKGLAVGARTILITKLFIVLTFPLAWPISWILDRILGDEVASYDRKRLMELIKMNAHREGAADELKIAVGAMEISDKVVRQIMTKIDDVFMLPDTTVLNTKTVAEILHMGYTRIPVFEAGDRNRVVSLLFVKDLALIDPDDNFTVQTVCGYHKHPLRFVMEDTPLRMMLEEFKKGDYHLAMVQTIVNSEDKDPSYELVGIVTLEDIVEEILQAEIVDETDAVTDNVHRTRRRGAQARDLSYLVNSAEPSRVISVQMQLMTMQWLTTNHRAFCQEMIGQNVLEKLIRQHVRRVELTHLPEMYDSKTAVPRNAKIFTKDEFTDKFVLILEGRALVTIGQDQMTFEAGPWQAFGTELLERIADQCTNGEKSITQSRGSLQLGDVDDPKKKNRIGFMPDFSVIVRDDCTFLEITATTYLLAYKTTCISRGQTRPSIGDGASPMDRSPELNKRAPSQTSLFSSVLQRTPSFQNVQNELANRLIRNGSNGKTRSCSESEKVELIPKIDFLSPRDPSLFSEESTRTIS